MLALESLPQEIVCESVCGLIDIPLDGNRISTITGSFEGREFLVETGIGFAAVAVGPRESP